jgi:hypothetical protein
MTSLRIFCLPGCKISDGFEKPFEKKIWLSIEAVDLEPETQILSCVWNETDQD